MEILIIIYQVVGVVGWENVSKYTNGIGGSEEAVICLSASLRSVGNTVHVKFLEECAGICMDYDICLVWRCYDISAVKKCAKRILLWIHDTPYPNAELVGLEEVDNVLLLSEFHHKTWLPVLSKLPLNVRNNYTIIGNGYDPRVEIYDINKVDRLSAMYTSSHSRGLEVLINGFEKIMTLFPKFKLYVFYDRLDCNIDKNGKPSSKTVKMYEKFDDLLIKYPNNLIYEGFVSLEKIERVYEKISLFLYPCIYPESYCISLLKAQCNGCIPIVNLHSAIKETITLTGENTCSSSIHKYMMKLIKTLHWIDNSPSQSLVNLRVKIMAEARYKNTWNDVAFRITNV